MPTVQQSADAFRRALLEHDSIAERALLDSYAQVWRALKASLDVLLADMQAAQLAGQEITPTWLYRSERYKSLLAQVEREVGGLAQSLNGALQGQTAYAEMLGAQNGVELISASLGGAGVGVAFDRFSSEAVGRLVGGLSAPSPLARLLESLAGDAAAAIRKALIVGVGTGQNPRVIARLVRDQAGIPLTRALTISRTESLRAYRDAALDTYQANSDVVQGWVWHSALGTRTCAFCWSMHGTFHPLDEAFSSHPNCRCSPTPSTRSYAELGIDAPDTRTPVPLGTDVFDTLSPEQQRQILGPGKWKAYTAGDITLDDVRGFGHSKEWGRYGYERPLREIVKRPAATPPPASPLVRMLQGHGLSRDAADTVERLAPELGRLTRFSKREAGAAVEMLSGAQAGSIVQGSSNFITLDEMAEQFAAMKPNRSYVHIHTHPSSSAFSDADGDFLLRSPELGALVVRGVNDTTYILSAGPSTRPAADGPALKRRWDALRLELKPPYQARYNAGEDGDTLWREQSHAIWGRLAPEFGLRYERLLPRGGAN